MNVHDAWLKLTVWAVVCLMAARAAAQAPASEIVIQTTVPERFVIAFDELAVESTTGRVDAALEQAAAALGHPAKARAGRATLIVSASARSLEELEEARKALARSRPESRVLLVLYEAGRPPSPSSRALLPSDLALIMQPGVAPPAAARAPALGLRKLGAPDTYGLSAPDPLAAVTLAETLRAAPGVRYAYPLVKRVLETR